MNFVALTFILLLSFGISRGDERKKVNLFLNRGEVAHPPSFQRYHVQCRSYPPNRSITSSLKWIAPDGEQISEDIREPVTVLHKHSYKTLLFKNPMPSDSGRYTCSMNGTSTKTVEIHFQETECPPNNFLLPNGCHRCPPNSATYPGATSIMQCVCKSGFRGSPFDGIPCSDINECLDRNFGCSHECKNVPGSAYCACPAGYYLRDFKICEDVDECSSEKLNRCSHRCHNTDGGYECSCDEGYVLVGSHRCEGCRKNSYRMGNDSFCVDCPANSVTDGMGKASIEDCKCLPGFIGDPGQGIHCVDIDECRDNNFGCSDECVNTPGSVHCSCPKGYELDLDSKNCIDIDECAANNGGCEGKCEDTEGSFRCTCDSGYEIEDFYSCSDVDECAVNNGGCGHICTNFRGGRYCSCRQGFKLTADQKSCIANRCPRVPEPPYSSMKCYKNPIPLESSRKNKVSLEVSESYVNGTTCYVKCDEGYKLLKFDHMQCLENGQWDKVPPSCIAKQCEPLSVPKHGAINPRSCARGTNTGRRCIYTCNRGYKLKGTAMVKCGKNQQWLRKKTHNEPSCKPIIITPHITCSDDITAVLEEGHNTTSIIVPGPQTLVGIRFFEVSPKWVRMDTGTVFNAGITEITFTARSGTDLNLTASCTVTVNVVDDEPPLAQFCPQSFTTAANSSHGTTVYWTEPVFTDNVGIKSITSNTRHGEVFLPGVYLVRYLALDHAGNEGTCEFVVNVTMPDCGYPKDPANGEMDCVDWIDGRLCMARCIDGYYLYPPEPSIFSCDDSGTWEPADVVQDCMQTQPAVNSSCPDGYEHTILDDTSSEICVECPMNMPWSEEERACTKTQESAS